MDYQIKRNDAPELLLSAEVMRHMLMETTDLLEESQTYLDIAETNPDAALALSTASRHLLDLSTWISRQMTGMPGKGTHRLGDTASAQIIDAGRLDDAMLRFVIRVERLYDRAARLDALTRAPMDLTPPRENGKVLRFPGSPAAAKNVAENPVVMLHKRLDIALRLG